MRHLDLFSGIGGFALAADRVWPQVEHIFCEIDPFCQKVLQKHWHNAPIHGDIKKIDGRSLGTIDVITGGFPCQPFSTAGKRKGEDDDRHLWPEMFRLIREIHPRWIIGENVGGILTWSGGLVVEQVFADLESAGYETQPFIIPAAGVGAPHRRDRIWFVAHSIGRDAGRAAGADAGTGTGTQKRVRQRDAVEQSRESDTVRLHANTDHTRLQRSGSKGPRLGRQSDRTRGYERPDWQQDWPAVAARLCRVDDGVPRGMDRAARLKALGNAIVPQVAEEIMSGIAAVDV